jgi:hypothetical protein
MVSPATKITFLVPPSELLSLEQVALLLQVTRPVVTGLIRDEGLPYVVVDGYKRVPVKSYRWWLASKERK